MYKARPTKNHGSDGSPGENSGFLARRARDELLDSRSAETLHVFNRLRISCTVQKSWMMSMLFVGLTVVSGEYEPIQFLQGLNPARTNLSSSGHQIAEMELFVVLWCELVHTLRRVCADITHFDWLPNGYALPENNNKSCAPWRAHCDNWYSTSIRACPDLYFFQGSSLTLLDSSSNFPLWKPCPKPCPMPSEFCVALRSGSCRHFYRSNPSNWPVIVYQCRHTEKP